MHLTTIYQDFVDFLIHAAFLLAPTIPLLTFCSICCCKLALEFLKSAQ